MRSVAIIGTRGYPSYYGGFETAVRKIAPHLADRGWDVTVYGRPGTVRLDDPDRNKAVKSVSTRGLNSKSLSTLSYGFSASLRAAWQRPDAALVMNVANGFFLPLLRARGVRTVVNVDGIEWDRAKWGKFAKSVFKLGARLTARYADSLIFDSRAIELRWGEEFERDGTYIPYGGDLPSDLPLEPGLQSRGYVLVVARFVPENTIPEFIDAAPLIAADWPVVIVGSSGFGGELDERVRELERGHDNITWLGHISDDRRLLGLWRHAGVYFHGHSVGGTNPTLVQAMALGSPTVARDTVYNREVLADSAAFVPAEPDGIAREVRRLMSDDVRQEIYASRAAARAARHYAWSRVCNAYEAILHDAIGDSERGGGDPKTDAVDAR